MAFVKYNYGGRAEEIKKLLRKRLTARKKVRFHEKRLQKYQHDIAILEDELDQLLTIAKGKP